jgi:prepilin-type N-terminal cleavage/methylation domain-containing protein
MNQCRGLTLLEVLAALVLMSMIAATVAPVLSESLAILREAEAGDPDLIGLNALADAYVEEHFVDVPAPADENFELPVTTMAWPDDPARDPASVQVLQAQAPGVDHLWLVFRDGTQFVLRALPLDVDDEGAGSR